MNRFVLKTTFFTSMEGVYILPEFVFRFPCDGICPLEVE